MSKHICFQGWFVFFNSCRCLLWQQPTDELLLSFFLSKDSFFGTLLLVRVSRKKRILCLEFQHFSFLVENRNYIIKIWAKIYKRTNLLGILIPVWKKMAYLLLVKLGIGSSKKWCKLQYGLLSTLDWLIKLALDLWGIKVINELVPVFWIKILSAEMCTANTEPRT